MMSELGANLCLKGSVLGSAGNGIIQALQGILASFSDGSSTGQLFAASALLELIAQLTGSFVFAKFFDIGLGIEAPWGVGTPFFASAVSRDILHLPRVKLTIVNHISGAIRIGRCTLIPSTNYNHRL